MHRLIALFLLVFSLSGCASALESATQDVTFLTPGTHDSLCYVDNGETKYRVWPPETRRIGKRPGPLTVKCFADGNREKTVVIDQESQPVALANAFNGFAPGLFVDYKTGALFIYPDTVTVDFTDMSPQSQALPNYELLLREDPSLFGMEEFRPGRPALMRDVGKVPSVMRKREDKDEEGGSQEVIAPASSGSAEAAEPITYEPSGEAEDSESLTIRMNPQVFSPSGTDSGAGMADTPPVTIYPLDQ